MSSEPPSGIKSNATNIALEIEGLMLRGGAPNTFTSKIPAILPWYCSAVATLHLYLTEASAALATYLGHKWELSLMKTFQSARFVAGHTRAPS